MQQVTVRVPATTSNFSPGLDCFGAALNLYNEVTVRREQAGRNSKMISEAATKFFRAGRVQPFQISVSIAGEVPVARGLGSSVTARLGVLHALNKLSRAKISRHDLFRLCAELEGHPDNAAPASFGGFTIATHDGVRRFEISSKLRFVLLVPDFEVATNHARKLLPKRVLLRDAIENVGNASALAAAFACGKYAEMRGAFRDCLHQPYRKKLVPFLDAVIAAAENAGALGAFLSGSGSSICAITLRSPQKIGAAMQTASRLTRARTIIARADNDGACVAGR